MELCRQSIIGGILCIAPSVACNSTETLFFRVDFFAVFIFSRIKTSIWQNYSQTEQLIHFVFLAFIQEKTSTTGKRFRTSLTVYYFSVHE